MKGRQLFAVVALLAVLAAICLPAYRVLRDAVAAAPHASVGQQLLPGAPYPDDLWRDEAEPPSGGAEDLGSLRITRGSLGDLPADLDWQSGSTEPEIGDPAALKGGTLRLSNAGPFPANFLAFGSPSPQFFHYNCFTTVAVPLVATHPMTGRSIPGVAEAWATRGRSVWFRLHPAARYSNGRPVRAGDYALGAHLKRRLAELGGPSSEAAAQAQAIAAIRVPADDLLEVELRDEADDLSAACVSALLYAAEPSFYAEFGSDYTERYRDRIPPTTGAYVIGRCERGRLIELRRNPHWWAADLRYRRYTCNADSIEHHFLTDEAQAWELLLRGRLDLLQTRDLNAWRRHMESGSEADVLDGSIERHCFRADYPMPPYGIALNAATLPNLTLRRGIMQALDMKGAIDRLFPGEGEQLRTFSTGYGALTPQHTPQYPYDPEAARALFAEAGYTERGADGILQRADGTRLSVSFTYVPSEKLSLLATLLAQSAKRCGLELRLDAMPWQQSAARLQHGEHELIFWATMAGSPLPDYRRHFGTGASGYDAPFGLSDPQLDKAIAAAERAHSPEERAAAMAKVDRLIAEQAVWLPGWKENLVLLACQHQVRFPDCEGCRFSTPAPYEIAEAHLYWIDPRHRPAGYEVERRYESPPESAPEPSGPAPTALPPSP